METKFDIGQKVVVKALVDSISTTKEGVMYYLTIFDGQSGWNNKVCIKESMLVRMNEKTEGE